MRWFSFFLFSIGLWAQSSDGWVDLFPDSSFRQWTRITVPPGKSPSEPSQWKVDSARRILICEGTGGHDMLRYNREFGDFVYHVEWKFTKLEGEAKYNSGVYVRNDAEGNIWHQAQCGLAGGYLFGNSPKAGASQRFNLSKQMIENRVKPAGEWNTYEIRCQGRNISLSVNGKVVSELADCEVTRGYVALEAEGYRIEFRNIKIKELK